MRIQGNRESLAPIKERERFPRFPFSQFYPFKPIRKIKPQEDAMFFEPSFILRDYRIRFCHVLFQTNDFVSDDEADSLFFLKCDRNGMSYCPIIKNVHVKSLGNNGGVAWSGDAQYQSHYYAKRSDWITTISTQKEKRFSDLVQHIRFHCLLLSITQRIPQSDYCDNPHAQP